MYAQRATPSAEYVLLTAVSRGNQRALVNLYDLHAPALTGQLLAAGHTDATAGKVLHDLFVAFWVAAPRLDPTTPFRDSAQRILTALDPR